jgi:hypothetical protein
MTATQQVSQALLMAGLRKIVVRHALGTPPVEI